MSANLMIQKPKVRPPLITLLSLAGMGKTSLAALFPNPIFIRTEDGMESIDEAVRPDAFPLVNTYDNLLDQLRHLIAMSKKPDFKYQTVVIDSVTPFDAMFIEHVIKSDQKAPRTINQALGGYGSGMKAVAGMHQNVRKALQNLNNRGMAVIILAHATVERLDPPDTEGFTIYSMRLAKDSVAPWVDQVDLVGYIKLRAVIVGEENERKKAKSYGDRVIVTQAVASNVSKNRYGIEDEIDLPKGENPLMALIPYYRDGHHLKGKPAPAAAVESEEEEPDDEQLPDPEND